MPNEHTLLPTEATSAPDRVSNFKMNALLIYILFSRRVLLPQHASCPLVARSVVMFAFSPHNTVYHYSAAATIFYFLINLRFVDRRGFLRNGVSDVFPARANTANGSNEIFLVRLIRRERNT